MDLLDSCVDAFSTKENTFKFKHCRYEESKIHCTTTLACTIIRNKTMCTCLSVQLSFTFLFLVRKKLSPRLCGFADLH